jgi:hypothetical protein
MAERCVPELAYLARNEYTNDVQYRSQHRKRQVSNVQLVEQHCISKRDPRYAIIDAAAFRSKNLYNAASYEMRQTFFNEGMYLTYEEIHRRMQSHEAYKALPAKVSQQILMLLANNWESFKQAKAAYEEDSFASLRMTGLDLSVGEGLSSSFEPCLTNRSEPGQITTRLQRRRSTCC